MLRLNPQSIEFDGEYHWDRDELAQATDDQLDLLRFRGKIDLATLYRAKFDRARVQQQIEEEDALARSQALEARKAARAEANRSNPTPPK